MKIYDYIEKIVFDSIVGLHRMAPPTCHHLHEDATQPPPIHREAMTAPSEALRDLRSYIHGGSATVLQLDRGRRWSGGRTWRGGSWFFHCYCESEVTQLDVTAVVNQNIFRFYISISEKKYFFLIIHTYISIIYIWNSKRWHQLTYTLFSSHRASNAEPMQFRKSKTLQLTRPLYVLSSFGYITLLRKRIRKLMRRQQMSMASMIVLLSRTIKWSCTVT